MTVDRTDIKKGQQLYSSLCSATESTHPGEPKPISINCKGLHDNKVGSLTYQIVAHSNICLKCTKSFIPERRAFDFRLVHFAWSVLKF